MANANDDLRESKVAKGFFDYLFPADRYWPGRSWGIFFTLISAGVSGITSVTLIVASFAAGEAALAVGALPVLVVFAVSLIPYILAVRKALAEPPEKAEQAKTASWLPSRSPIFWIIVGLMISSRYYKAEQRRKEPPSRPPVTAPAQPASNQPPVVHPPVAQQPLLPPIRDFRRIPLDQLRLPKTDKSLTLPPSRSDRSKVLQFIEGFPLIRDLLEGAILFEIQRDHPDLVAKWRLTKSTASGYQEYEVIENDGNTTIILGFLNDNLLRVTMLTTFHKEDAKSAEEKFSRSERELGPPRDTTIPDFMRIVDRRRSWEFPDLNLSMDLFTWRIPAHGGRAVALIASRPPLAADYGVLKRSLPAPRQK